MTAMYLFEKAILKSSKFIVLIGVLVSILGIVSLIYPNITTEVATIMVGVFMIINGLFRISYACFSNSIGMTLLKYFMAILMLIGGAWIIGNHEMSLPALTFVMATILIIDGITQMSYSLTLFSLRGGLFFLSGGIVSLAIGFLIYAKWPESSHYAIGILFGLKLLFDGLSIFLTGITLKKASKSFVQLA